jgi:hypothetical protein
VSSIDERSLLPNLVLRSLLTARQKPGDVYRNFNVECLKHRLAAILLSRAKLAALVSAGVDEIVEHCVGLRGQVRAHTDTLLAQEESLDRIEAIGASSAHLIDQIDLYEKQCLRSFDNKTGKGNGRGREELEKLLGEAGKFHTAQTSYLCEFRSEERVVERALATGEKLLLALKVKVDCLLKCQFDFRYRNVTTFFFFYERVRRVVSI